MNRDVLRLFQRILRNLLSQAKRRKSSAPLWIAILTIAVFGISQLLESPTAPLPSKGAELSCQVNDVYDGDTLEAGCDNGKLKVRMFGIDAPEMGQKPWGNESRDQLRALLPSGSALRLQVIDTDRYGRVVARLYSGDQDVGFTMVRQGWAVVYAQYNTSNAYVAAQAQAKSEGLGCGRNQALSRPLGSGVS